MSLRLLPLGVASVVGHQIPINRITVLSLLLLSYTMVHVDILKLGDAPT